jgi:hypothetical protein
MFALQRVVLNELPAIRSVPKQRTQFQVERPSLHESVPTLIAYAIDVVRVEGSSEKPLLVDFVGPKPCLIQSYPVREEGCAIGREDHDGLTNGIRDRSKIGFTLPQPLLGVLTVINVRGRNVPADDLAALV